MIELPSSTDVPVDETPSAPAAAETTLELDLPLDPAVEAGIDQFAAVYPFELDAFQREAIRTFLHGDSVMVAAPTGSGKTVVAEFGVYDAFKRTGRVLYTTPIKALSNQKFRDLRALYGTEVGLLTGDITENREARVLVMTTEILRNMLLQSPWELDDVECVIFDEIHYLADPERGTTWEESIILCPEHIQLICLSATVSNADEIAGWIGRTHRPIRLITHTKRPVPLALYYFHDDHLSEVVDHHGALVRDFAQTGGEARRQPGRGPGGRRSGERQVPVLDEPQAHEIIDALHDQDLLPAIYFLFSRNDCQAYAERLAAMRPKLVRPEREAAIEQVLQSYVDNLRPEDRALEQVQLITRLARRGIGFHHAGLLPVLKQLVEVLFSRGLMQVVFATDTLALGVNMPARTVVVGRMSKWDGRRRRILIPNEFQQMAGRAGRRGMDRFGHVVVPYSPWFTFRETLEVATGELHPVQSAFAIRYNTVLNLWDPPQGERVRQMLQRSLAQYQTSERVRLLEQDLVEIGADIAGIPAGCLIGYDDGDNLLEEYQALGRSLDAARNAERRLREELRSVQAATDGARPWTEPGRPLLRRVLRESPAGVVVHSRDWGWGISVGRNGGGIGRFLFRDANQFRHLSEYRQIDYLPDQHVDLPLALIEPPHEITSAADLVDGETLTALWQTVDELNLPDLEARAAEHRERTRERARERIASLERDSAERVQHTRQLVATRTAHPCHPCPVRKEHRDNLRRIDALERERNALAELLEREIEAEEVRSRNVIRGIRDVLHRFGYLRRGFPTPKADMLADIFDNDGLILCELVDRGALDRLSPDELAEVFSWFSFDRDFRYANHFTLTENLIGLRHRLEDIEHEVLSEERDHGIFISEGHNPSFYGAALAWCRGRSMVEIGEQIELSEGDLVLTFNKTIDLMRQVREMLADVQPDHPLRDKLSQAERRLRRGIVEQSLSLGFTSFAPVEEAPLDDDEQADDETTDEVDAGS
ncbi:MAG: DEAD/DEAH box helicase [Chloroflexota bacterium]|nr:DEAD/DEAH box helicase [Chloroflexota bacterium]